MLKTIGVIIAGGNSTRMEADIDKCLLNLNNKPIISHVIERLAPQVDGVIINANGDKSRFNFTNLTIIPDLIDKDMGPLIGIYSAMQWVKENISDDALIACVPSDSPFFPDNLIEELTKKHKGNSISCAFSNNHLHPIFNLISVSLADELYKNITENNQTAVYKWIKQQKHTEVSFDNNLSEKDFFNINTKEDLISAEGLLKA